MTRRFASPQPNIPGQGILAGYSARFWGLVVVIGVATGLAGAGFVALLNLVERVGWRRPASQFLAAVTAASPARIVLVLLGAGVLAGAGTLLVRGRLRGSGGGEVSEAIWLRGGRLELLPSLVRGMLSIVTVGMGASLGREGAPQLAGAAFASELCERNRQITPRSGGCSSPPAPAPAWRPSTTCRSAARCSRSRSCSARSRCRSCCPRC